MPSRLRARPSICADHSRHQAARLERSVRWRRGRGSPCRRCTHGGSSPLRGRVARLPLLCGSERQVLGQIEREQGSRGVGPRGRSERITCSGAVHAAGAGAACVHRELLFGRPLKLPVRCVGSPARSAGARRAVNLAAAHNVVARPARYPVLNRAPAQLSQSVGPGGIISRSVAGLLWPAV